MTLISIFSRAILVFKVNEISFLAEIKILFLLSYFDPHFRIRSLLSEGGSRFLPPSNFHRAESTIFIMP